MALITLDGMLFKARIPCGSWKNPDISTKDSEFDALFKLYQLSFRNGLGHQLVWCAETITKNDGRMCGLVRSCKWTSYSHFLPANTRDSEIPRPKAERWSGYFTKGKFVVIRRVAALPLLTGFTERSISSRGLSIMGKQLRQGRCLVISVGMS